MDSMFLMSQAKGSIAIAIRAEDEGHLCLVPLLIAIAFQYVLLIFKFAWGFWYKALGNFRESKTFSMFRESITSFFLSR